MSKVEPGIIGKAITRVQEAHYEHRYARWQHAAVCLGAQYICEATRKGVNVDSIYKYCDGKHLLYFRSPPVEPLESMGVALQATMRRGYRYHFGSCLRIWWQSKRGAAYLDELDPRHFAKRATICSQLYADAYGMGTLTTLLDEAGSVATPAQLAHTPRLVDKEMQWYRVPAAGPQLTDPPAQPPMTTPPTSNRIAA